MLPREFGLTGNVFGEAISIYREAGRSRSHQPAQIRLSLDGIAIAADLPRNTDIVNRVHHIRVPSLLSPSVAPLPGDVHRGILSRGDVIFPLASEDLSDLTVTDLVRLFLAVGS